jgi:hypothetical protein
MRYITPLDQAWWVTAVIPHNQEAEVGGLWLVAQAKAKDPVRKQSKSKRTGGVAHGGALAGTHKIPSSIQSITGRNKKARKEKNRNLAPCTVVGAQ